MVAWICGVVAIVTLLAWLWEQDRPLPCREATVGEDREGRAVTLPVGATGAASHSGWATIIRLVVDAGVFLSFLFAYVHVSMRLDVCPPPGARLPAPWMAGLACGLLAIGGLLAVLARRRPLAARQGALCWLLGGAVLAVTAGFGLELAGQIGSGLAPASHAWSAAVAAMVAYQGLHVMLCAITGIYVIARSLCRHLTPHSRGSLDNTVLIFYYTVLQGAVMGVAVHLWPRLMG